MISLCQNHIFQNTLNKFYGYIFINIYIFGKISHKIYLYHFHHTLSYIILYLVLHFSLPSQYLFSHLRSTIFPFNLLLFHSHQIITNILSDDFQPRRCFFHFNFRILLSSNLSKSTDVQISQILIEHPSEIMCYFKQK